MADLSEILRVLEAERERYVLEAADLERRLSFVRNQIQALEALIPKYVLEEKIHHTYKRLPESSTMQVFLGDRTHSTNNKEELKTLEQESETEQQFQHQTIPTSTTPQSNSVPNLEQTTPTQEEPDISDIPKLSVPRKPGTLPLLPEFQEYSIQNAILILMRRKPDMHFHIDAIVRDLYGNKLTPEQFRTAKTNVGKMLSIGVQAGMWYRVLHAHGVYTLKYEKGVTSKQIKPVKKK